jgi:hypothetical protein
MGDAAAAEQRLRRRAIEITFLAPDPEGDPEEQELSARSLPGLEDSADEDEVDLDQDFDQPSAAAAAAEQQLQEEPEDSSSSSSSSSGGTGAARTARPPSSKSRGGRVQTGPARIAAELQLPLKR